MRKMYINFLIWSGIFKRFETKKRHAMLKEVGYECLDNTELNKLLVMATKKAKEKANEIPT